MMQAAVGKRKRSHRGRLNARLAGRAVPALLLLLVGGGVLAGAWLAFGKFSQARQASRLEDAQRAVQGMADAGSELVAAYVRQLQQLSKNTQIRQALKADDASLLQRQGDEFIGQFDAGLRLRILKPDNVKRDADSDPPLGFRSVNLLSQAAQSRQPIKAEVHFNASPQAHIVMIERIQDADGQLVGLLHLSLDVSLLDTLLAGTVLDGYMELRQATGSDKTLTLTTVGAASTRAGEVISQPVAHSRWQIVYWSGDTAAGSVLNGGLFLPMAAVLLLAVGLFLRKRSSGGRAGFAADGEVVYAGAVKAIMQGAHPGMEKLVPNLPNMGTQGSITPVSRGMVGEDVTMIATPPSAEAAAMPASVATDKGDGHGKQKR